MGAEVKLVGIGEIVLETKLESGRPVLLRGRQGIVSEFSELGFSSLRDTLRFYAEENPRVLVAAEASEPGVSQFFLSNIDAFLDHVQRTPHYWDSVGFGWPAAVGALHQDLEHGHLLTWWFISES